MSEDKKASPKDQASSALPVNVESALIKGTQELLGQASDNVQKISYPTASCLLPGEIHECVTQARLPDERFDHVLQCSVCTALLTAAFPGGGGAQLPLLGVSLDDLLLEAVMLSANRSSLDKATGFRRRLKKWLSTYFPDIAGWSN